MGQSPMLKAWALRGAFLAVLVGLVPHILEQEKQDPQTLLRRTAQVFKQAGYQTELKVDQAWGGSTRAGEAALVARSPLCGSQVRVRTLSISNLADDFRSTSLQPGTSYAFGEWSGQQISRVQLMIELMRLRLRGAFSFGRSPWARTAVLMIEDPSACMAIRPAPTADVWL